MTNGTIMSGASVTAQHLSAAEQRGSSMQPELLSAPLVLSQNISEVEQNVAMESQPDPHASFLPAPSNAAQDAPSAVKPSAHGHNDKAVEAGAQTLLAPKQAHAAAAPCPPPQQTQPQPVRADIQQPPAPSGERAAAMQQAQQQRQQPQQAPAPWKQPLDKPARASQSSSAHSSQDGPAFAAPGPPAAAAWGPRPGENRIDGATTSYASALFQKPAGSGQERSAASSDGRLPSRTGSTVNGAGFMVVCNHDAALCMLDTHVLQRVKTTAAIMRSGSQTKSMNHICLVMANPTALPSVRGVHCRSKHLS